MERNKNLIITIIVLVFLLGTAIVIAQFFEDFENVRLRKSNKTIFTSSDLIISKLSYNTSEKEIKKNFKKLKKETTYEENGYKYKKLEYKKLTLTLKENYDDFVLCKVETTSRKYLFSRNIRVGDSINKTARKYRVEKSKGNYLYGNYTMEALNNNETDKQIYFGVRTKDKLMYLNRDNVINGKYSYISKITFDVKHGKVSKISWSYDIK